MPRPPASTSWRIDFLWPVFRCPRLAGFGCPLRIGQLVRLHGEPPTGACLAIRSCLHDFGTYYEVVCYFDPHNPEAERYAFACEDGLPEYWDYSARQQIEQGEEERV